MPATLVIEAPPQEHEAFALIRIPTIERLEEAVARNPGAVIVITHDDDFAEVTTTTSWHLEHGVLEDEEF